MCSSYPRGHFTCWMSPGWAFVSWRQMTSASLDSMKSMSPFLRADLTPLTFQETIFMGSAPDGQDRDDPEGMEAFECGDHGNEGWGTLREGRTIAPGPPKKKRNPAPGR